MYGGVGDKTGVEKKGLIPKLVMAFIKGSQRDMDEWIAAGRSVEGTVSDLEEGERAYPNSDFEGNGDELEEDDDSDGGDSDN